ncbi:MAG TPA: PEGA domain-containing protein, partial [Myxococcota bacterium]|nr:PEGA domain-containing protein [Myxococcota bacterium]
MPALSWTGLALISLLAAPAPGPLDLAPAAKGVLLWHLNPVDGATPELVHKVELQLRKAFEAVHADQLLPAMTMDSLLLVEGNERYLRCGTGAACLAGLGKQAGARIVLSGEVGLREGQLRVRLVRIEVASEAQDGEAIVLTSGELTAPQLEELRVGMFEPARYLGSLELACDTDGAEVLVDGERVGLTPLVGPLARLPAGLRKVEVRLDGHQPFEREVWVPFNRLARVVVVLPAAAYVKKAGLPFWEDWPFWTTLVVGLGGMAAGGVLLADAGVLEDNAEALRAAHLVADAEQGRADDRSLQAYVMFGVGGAGLLAAGLV